MGTKKNNLGVRIAMAVIGIALTAVSVGLQKISGLGVDPFLFSVFPMPFMRHIRPYILWCVPFC